MDSLSRLKIANLHRFDMIINLLFINQHYKKNDYGQRLYELSKQHGPSKFIKLIESFAKKRHHSGGIIVGFKKGYLPVTNNYYLNNDGIHRLACSSYFNIADVPIKIVKNPYKYINHYGLKWLQETYNNDDIEFIINFYCKYTIDIFCDGALSERTKNINILKHRINHLIKKQYDDTNIKSIGEYIDLIFINQYELRNFVKLKFNVDD